MVIKHLVFSGGSYHGLKIVGVLKKLHEDKFYNIENIKNIYATSVGSLIAVIISLKIPFEDIYQYIVKRPWDKAFNLSTDMLFNMLSDKGILDKSFFLKILIKLFKTADLSVDITMKDFFNTTNIFLHLFSVKVNNFEVIELSHITYPDLPIIDAVYMSCSIPFIFQPAFFEDSYMIDGAVLCNFPITQCINNVDVNKDEILAINIIYKKNIKKEVGKNTNLLKYAHHLFDSLVSCSNKKNYDLQNIKYLITIEANLSSVDIGYKLMQESSARKKQIDEGGEISTDFLAKIEKL